MNEEMESVFDCIISRIRKENMGVLVLTLGEYNCLREHKSLISVNLRGGYLSSFRGIPIAIKWYSPLKIDNSWLSDVRDRNMISRITAGAITYEKSLSEYINGQYGK